MLRYALRRMLWVFPSVLAVSLISFFVLSLMPSPYAAAVEGGDPELLEARRRHHFLDLPLFFNVRPMDVNTRATHAVEVIAGGEDAEAVHQAQRELARLGGAALPIVLPQLDSLAPDRRVRVALALAPIADRMGIEHRGQASEPARVVVFWNRFWGSRSIEFREAAARSAVKRYARYGTDARAIELRRLDTFALPSLMSALYEPRSPAELDQLRRLVELIAHVTTRDDRIAEDASAEDGVACVQRWRRFWMVYQSDHVRLIGAERVAAFALQTRYGKWVFETVVLQLGKDLQGRPLLQELLARARVTARLLLWGIALAYFFAIPLGSLAAYRRERAIDRLISTAVLLPYIVSPAVLALLALWLGAGDSSPMVVVAVLLGLTLLADPTRHQRSALLPVLTADYVRAAVARGAGPLRVLFVHGLRNAIVPVTTRAATELPMALTACFVLEHVFGLHGLAEVTLEAVKHHDTGWLMALAVSGAVWAVVALVMTDVAYALLDPRMRRVVYQLRGRST
jgi:peptide/nickel transport system permease protein